MQPFQVIDFHVVPSTIGAHQATLIWEKPLHAQAIFGYQLFLDNDLIQTRPTNKTHWTLTNLSADQTYQVTIICLDHQGCLLTNTAVTTTFRTKKKSVLLDVTQAPYHADSAGKEDSTAILQQAINDCPSNGTVWIPTGAVILSGALELKSNMIFQVDGTLQASLDIETYRVAPHEYLGSVNQEGLPLSRYEGWELFCFRSLINIGYIDRSDRGRIVCENVRLCGKGTIIGGGNPLGLAMRNSYADREQYPEYVSDGKPGRRVRGRLICMMQAKNIHLTELTLIDPPCWTVHMIYCDTVVTHGVNIQSKGIDNGDGWDPDSSQNLLIFDTVFDTGDDCIAIKSGKNPEGNQINRPAKNIRLFDLAIRGGHGIAIGSEQSGGVENITFRDCQLTNTLYGLELKAQNDRGGYIRQVTITDCLLDRFMAHPVAYNADGQAAQQLPIISDILVKNTRIVGQNPLVELKGFVDEQAQQVSPIQRVAFESVAFESAKGQKKMIFEQCQEVSFKEAAIIDRATISDAISCQETVELSMVGQKKRT